MDGYGPYSRVYSGNADLDALDGPIVRANFYILQCLELYIYERQKKFILRLYLSGVIMSFIQWRLSIPNNFFRSLFSLVVILCLIETYQKKNNFCKKLMVYLCWQIGSIELLVLLSSCSGLSENFIGYVMAAVSGSVFFLEGGLVYVLLGVLFWIFRERKKKLAVSFCLFDIALFGLTATSIISMSMGWLRFHFRMLEVPLEILGYLLDTVIGLAPVELGGSMWMQNYEWMMIGALPFILFYNNKRGKPVKWFFYVIYPVYIIVLWWIGNFYL